MNWVLAASATAVLVACGGGTDPVVVASSNVVVPVTAATATAIVGQSFSFPAGVADLGTTAATTVAVSGTAASKTVSIASAGQTASGPMTFGSCIMTITTSTFPATSPLAVGKVITVNPCTISARVANAIFDGTPVQRDVFLQFGLVVSLSNSTPVTVNKDGTVVVGGQVIGSAPGTQLTGT